MVYNPCLPGNSSVLKFSNINSIHQSNYVNPNVFSKITGKDLLEECDIISLSFLTDHLYLNSNQQIIFDIDGIQQKDCKPLPQISLVKIDAEGSELDILNSLKSTQWKLINQFVIESVSNSDNVQQIEILLISNGYKVILSNPWPVDTGNVMIYARRS